MSYNNAKLYEHLHDGSGWTPAPQPNAQGPELQEQVQPDNRPYAQQVGMPMLDAQLAPVPQQMPSPAPRNISAVMAQTPEGPVPLPEHLERYRGWINLANQKHQLLASLTADELAAIDKLKDKHPTGQLLTISEREEAMKGYRAIFQTMVTKRQAYTGYIEKQLFTQVTEPEKRIQKETNTAYQVYAQATLNLRLEEERKSREANAANNELALFETHLKNEYLRIATEYRIMMWKEIAGFYRMHLGEAVKRENYPLPNLREFKEILMTFSLGQVTKFTRQYITPEQCTTVWQRTPQPNFQLLQEETLKSVDEKFSLWSNDVAMAKSGQEVHDETAQVIQEVQQEVAQEVAANVLIGSTGSGVTIVPEGSKIKRFVEVQVIEEERWSKSVIMNWVRYPESHSFARNRKWSTLNIGQMAEALAKYATEKQIPFMDGLIFKDGVK